MPFDVSTQEGREAANAAEPLYWKSLPLAVQRLNPRTNPEMRDESARVALAQQLAESGYLIDVPIMVWGWHAYWTMLIRMEQGFTWVPSANMPNIPVGPGLNFPGLPAYDPNNPPPGSIRVTLDWAEPKPDPPPLPETALVGIEQFDLRSQGGPWRYASTEKGNGKPAGFSTEQAGGTFTKRIDRTLMGASHWWERAK